MRKIKWHEIETVEYTDYLAETLIENTPEQACDLIDILDEYIIDGRIYLKGLYDDAFHNDGFIPFFENRDKVRKWFNLYESEIDDILSGEHGDDIEIMPVDSDGVLYAIVHSVWQYVARIFFKMIEEALDLEPVAVNSDGLQIYDVVDGVTDEIIVGYAGEAPELYALHYSDGDDEASAYFSIAGVQYNVNEFIRVNYPEL